MKPVAVTLYPACLAIASCALVLMLGYPGQLTQDSFYQLLQVRSETFSNLHPPLMQYLWWLFGRIMPHTGFFWAIQIVLYWSGWWCFSRVVSSHSRIRCAIILVGFWPPLLYLSTTLNKDLLLMNALLWVVIFAIYVLRQPKPISLFSLAAALLAACLLRHNALFAALPFLYLIAHCTGKDRATRSAVFLCLFGTFLVTQWAVNTRSASHRTSMWPVVGLWDMAAVSLETHQMFIPPHIFGVESPTLEMLRDTFDPRNSSTTCRVRADGVRLLPCYESLPMIKGPFISAADVEALMPQWLAMIADHPYAYLHHRLRVSCYLFALCGTSPALITSPIPTSAFTAGLSTTHESLAALSMPVSDAQHSIPLNQLLGSLRDHTVLFDGWFYLALLAALTVWQCTRPSTHTLRLELYCTLSVWCLVLPLIFIAPNDQMRFLMWLYLGFILSAILSIRAHFSRFTAL